jgi:hypothetical protein
MAVLLKERGISTEVLDSRSNEAGLTPDIISRFKKGETQVLCATKGELLRSCLSAFDCSSVLMNSSALGRGFHDLDIRFIFHAVVPLSLRDYVQETGRGGRDGKQAVCVLFFSFFDKSKAANVVGLQPNRRGALQGGELKRAKEDLERVIEYALTGDKCRYSMLAKYVTFEDARRGTQFCPDGFECDNCCARKGKPFALSSSRSVNGDAKQSLLVCKSDVSGIVRKCFSRLLERSQQSIGESNVGKHIRKTLSDCLGLTRDKRQKLLLQALTLNPSRKSVVDELLRCLGWNSGKFEHGAGWERFESVLNSIDKKELSFYVQNAKLPPSDSSDSAAANAIPTFGIYVDAIEGTLVPFPGGLGTLARNGITQSWISTLPFLVQFEICRYVFAVA